jgi:tetratricopeptide (TPR) repeat protein
MCYYDWRDPWISGRSVNSSNIDEAYRLLSSGDHARACKLLSELERSGSIQAKIYLGCMYQNGQGVNKDSERALGLFCSASDAGAPLGSFYAGRLLETQGRLQEAVDYYRIAAHGGDISAAYALYRLGRRAAADISNSETDRYFQQALEGGHLYAKRDHLKLMLQGRFGAVGVLKGIPLFVATAVKTAHIMITDPTSDKLR